MNTIIVGTMALLAGFGVGIGVNVTTVVHQPDVEQAVVSALRTYDAEKRERDAQELAALKEARRQEAEAIWNKAMKGWGETGSGTK